MTTAEGWAALLTLTVLEIVLGIDNIIFIAIVAGKLPHGTRERARRLGLFLAMFIRIALLLSIVWVMSLTRPLMVLFGEEQEKGKKAAARKRGPVPQWQQHIEAIARLPRSRQQFVAEMLRNVLGEGAAR